MNESQRDDFLARVAAYQDGGLAESELAKFDLELREDREKLELFIETQKQSAAIAELCRHRVFVSDDSMVASPKQLKWRLVPIVWASLALAGCLAFFLLLPSRDGDPSLDVAIQGRVIVPPGCAVITYANFARWEGTSLPLLDKYLDHHDHYQLQAGSTRFEMPSGAIVSIAGPASFRLLDSKTIKMVKGKMTARMPHEESELKVIAGDLEVRDMGTAFGLSTRDNGMVDVAVFDGKVAARVTSDPLYSEEQTFVEGKGFSTKGDGKGLREIPFAPEMYQDIWPLSVGIDEASNLIEFVAPGPDLSFESLASDHKLFLIPEQLNHRVVRDIGVDFFGAGASWPANKDVRQKIGVGNIVSSYLLVYQPEDMQTIRRLSLSGSVTFEHEILGVAVGRIQLQRSDREFGLAGIDYASMDMRWLEDVDTEEGLLPADSLRISEDGRQLYFHLNVGAGMDHIRILVGES
ncbi:FecR protein [Planctomycetes bacterium CA13]|uniref:FecR protein n=1 Tax=Novipirellula herctigrandis TaxID=2527986 RepID=A0A5C5Z884_9BACT|nr:FecR protein [Planctomycetes bacterium CA13]